MIIRCDRSRLTTKRHMKPLFGLLAITLLTHLAFPLQSLAKEKPGAVKGNEQPAAESNISVDQVRNEAGKLIAVADGKTFTPTNTVSMPFKIKVMTNLTFTVNQGSPRKLTEGQILKKDGTLQSPDGSLTPVMDHITQKDGRVIIYKDGQAKPLEGEHILGDGSRVSADGTYVDQSGHSTRLLDGQLIRLDGSTFPATDTATLRSGKVVIQKDGSLITLRPNQTMMMSDGTKVKGDGTVIDKDGNTSQLTEGKVLRIEGVRRK